MPKWPLLLSAQSPRMELVGTSSDEPFTVARSRPQRSTLSLYGRLRKASGSCVSPRRASRRAASRTRRRSARLVAFGLPLPANNYMHVDMKWRLCEGDLASESW